MVEIGTLSLLLTAIQLMGLASAGMVRLTQGSCRQAWSQSLFLVALALVGIGAVAGLALGRGWCLTSGATLSVMVLTATTDLRFGI
jgi:hypothetical protein